MLSYADLESPIKRINGCADNPKNSSTAKIGQHIARGNSVSTVWAFDGIVNKYNTEVKTA